MGIDSGHVSASSIERRNFSPRHPVNVEQLVWGESMDFLLKCQVLKFEICENVLMATISRRRNQPDISKLPLVARFLSHTIAQRGMTQVAVANALFNCSVSTVSRWFRGETDLNEGDLDDLSQVLDVPGNTLRALRLLETLQHGPMVATVAAWRYMIDGPGSRLLVLGATMNAGMVHLLDAWPSQKEILVSLHDPLAEPSPLEALEAKYETPPRGRMEAYWLSAVTSLQALASHGRDVRVRLWVRPDDEFTVNDYREVGQLVANDWIAIEAPSIRRREEGIASGTASHPETGVYFFGDSEWKGVVEPLIEMMATDVEEPRHSLIWDSAWASGDSRLGRLRERFEAVMAKLSADRFMS
jgi:hypothetical protein